MNPKPKPCKGIGRAKGFKGCGQVTPYRQYGLCPSCRAEWLLTTDDGKLVLERATLKATKARRELEQAEKEHNERKSLPNLLQQTKNAVHRYVRARDQGKPCISCGTPWRSNFQAGHCYKAELFSTLKYDYKRNIHGQCEQCNIRKRGNESNYHLRLPDRIGQEAYDQLREDAKRDKHPDFKWDREELKQIIKTVQTLYKNLK